MTEFGVRDLFAIVLLDRVFVLEKFFLAQEFRHGEEIARLGVCVPSRAFEQARFKATRERERRRSLNVFANEGLPNFDLVLQFKPFENLQRRLNATQRWRGIAEVDVDVLALQHGA